MWFVNSYNYHCDNTLFQELCVKNPQIKIKYDEITERLTADFAKTTAGEVHSKCLMSEKGTFNFEDGRVFEGYLFEVEFGFKGDNTTASNLREHRLMLVMQEEEPVDLIEINHCSIKHKAKVYQFPNIKRGPREFFLKEPNPKDPK